MNPAEKRSHRLNYLLKIYLNNVDEDNLLHRARLMGVSDKTAIEYVNKVIAQATRHAKQVLAL